MNIICSSTHQTQTSLQSHPGLRRSLPCHRRDADFYLNAPQIIFSPTCNRVFSRVASPAKLPALLWEEGESWSYSEVPIKRRHLISNILEEVYKAENLEKYVEPLLRKLVQEAVGHAFVEHTRSTSTCSSSRTLRLHFSSNLPDTLFTGSTVVSEDRSPLNIILLDSTSKQIVASGPLASSKVDVVVLNGDFGPEDDEDWSKREFDDNIVQNREGKRPLVIGELTVQLQNGVGVVRKVSFTDNSSWIRSGKFRLGAKLHPCADEMNVREATSNAVKVRDHRGESYQKHHPPFLHDDIWRLEKIAKDGASHQKLAQSGISCVQDFLRQYEISRLSLHSILNVSNKIWEAIINHASTCILDDNRYMYKTAQGTGLLFNCIYRVVGVTFDGHTYLSMDKLDGVQLSMVEDLKRNAYENILNWTPAGDQPFACYPTVMANSVDGFSLPNMGSLGADLPVGHEQPEIQVINHHPSLSPPYDCEVEQENSSFEIGESSQMFNLPFTTSTRMSDSPGRYYGHKLVLGTNYMESQLSTEDLLIKHFEE